MKKGLKIALIAIICLVPLLLAAVHVVLNSTIVTGAIDGFARDNIDGRLGYSKLKVSYLRHFPELHVTMDSVALTYPRDRFARHDASSSLSPLLAEGRGEREDTLASLGRVHVCVDLWELLGGSVRLKELRLEGLSVYMRRYGGNLANWNVFKPSAPTESSGADSLRLPDFHVERISLENSRVVFASIPDTLFASVDIPSVGASAFFRLPPDTLELRDAIADVSARLCVDMPGLASLSTGMTLELSADGLYTSSSMPRVTACLRFPDARASYVPVGVEAGLVVDLDAELRPDGYLTADIHEFKASAPGLDLKFDGSVKDLLGKDPHYELAAGADARVAELLAALPESLRVVSADGDLRLALEVSTSQSQLETYKFRDASIEGVLQSGRLAVASVEDSLNAELFNTLVRIRSGADGLFLNADFDSLYANKGVEFIARVRNIRNSAGISKVETADTLVPRIELRSAGDRAFVKLGSSRFGVRDVDMSAVARKRVRRHSGRRRSAYVRQLSESLHEEDFRKADLNFSPDSTLAKYLRSWSPSGHLHADFGFFASPALPLRTRLNALHLDFTDNDFVIDTVGVVCGTSDLGASGRVSGLRRALFRNGLLEADLKLDSRRLNVNEMVSALELGRKDVGAVAPEDEFDESFVTDTLADVEIAREELPLLVVPANLALAVDLHADRVDYADMEIAPISTGLRMRDRTLQLTGTEIGTGIGDIYLDAFYSTRTKEDISGGINLRLKDMSAHEIVSLMPSVDSLMPALRSFYGKLACELSATARIDTNMNVVMPSLDALVRISGEDLEIRDAGELRKITRLLLFENHDIGHIDNLNVDALVRDSKVEVFPFELGLDRYRFVLRGTQHFDRTMYYHLSVLKSPFLLRFGVNIFGTPENWKFTIGRARFKDGSIPTFTRQLDTVQLNLAKSIRRIYDRGVDNVIRHNRNSIRDFDFAHERGDDLLDKDEFRQIESITFDREMADFEDQLISEVDMVLQESYIDTAKMMERYQEEVYDKKILRRMERMKRQEERRAARKNK